MSTIYCVVSFSETPSLDQSECQHQMLVPDPSDSTSGTWYTKIYLFLDNSYPVATLRRVVYCRKATMTDLYTLPLSQETRPYDMQLPSCVTMAMRPTARTTWHLLGGSRMMAARGLNETLVSKSPCAAREIRASFDGTLLTRSEAKICWRKLCLYASLSFVSCHGQGFAARYSSDLAHVLNHAAPFNRPTATSGPKSPQTQNSLRVKLLIPSLLYLIQCP